MAMSPGFSRNACSMGMPQPQLMALCHSAPICNSMKSAPKKSSMGFGGFSMRSSLQKSKSTKSRKKEVSVQRFKMQSSNDNDCTLDSLDCLESASFPQSGNDIISFYDGYSLYIS